MFARPRWHIHDQYDANGGPIGHRWFFAEWLLLGQRHADKTSNHNNDSWFIGFNKAYTGNLDRF